MESALKQYRKDIDGLRAISIISVILYHFGFVKNGYLGVDVFFVISGYLITKILFDKTNSNTFSVSDFYLRRIRRIIPLVLFTSTSALIAGVFLMLPDDLENLSQSVIATNLFSNNILLYITSGDYWNVINEFKPLMHTWSLSVEEQFYLLFPFLFFICRKNCKKFIVPILALLTIVSIILFLFENDKSITFYFLPYRFFELSLGGLGSIFFSKIGQFPRLKPLFLIVLVLTLFVDFALPEKLTLLIVVITTLVLLVGDKRCIASYNFILENKIIVGIGKISYGMYLWHQIILAFCRYSFLDNFTVLNYFLIFVITIILSIFTYYIVEQPFRNKSHFNNKTLLWIVSIVFFVTTISSFIIYRRSGIIKDIPEIGASISNVKPNMHSAYNSKIYTFDRDFSDTSLINVLVCGDSFARDWANVLLESEYQNQIEISYFENPENYLSYPERFAKADIIFISGTSLHRINIKKMIVDFKLNEKKVFIIGLKYFGVSNGIFYKNKKKSDYFEQKVKIPHEIINRNNNLKKIWKDQYIDLIGKLADNDNKVPVFTPDKKFISGDCRHFTRSGATFFSILFHKEFSVLFNNKINGQNE